MHARESGLQTAISAALTISGSCQRCYLLVTNTCHGFLEDDGGNLQRSEVQGLSQFIKASQGLRREWDQPPLRPCRIRGPATAGRGPKTIGYFRCQLHGAEVAP